MSDRRRVQVVGDVEYKYSAEWTKVLESKEHWEFYWYQQKLMEGLVEPRADRILELGTGTGFAANYCRSKGVDVTTLDIDEEKRPDIVANVVTYDFDQRFDHLMAFEILEHIPYEQFELTMRKIPKFVRKFAFISLPRNERVALGLQLKLPKFRQLAYEWRILNRKIACEAHHWELDFGEYTTRRVERLFADTGLQIVRRMSCDYIRFYALEVVGATSSR
jgi:hypothetical protein